MTNQSLMQKSRPRREGRPGIPDPANAHHKKAIDAPVLIDSLWRQIDRWVNEGGAPGEGTLPEMIANQHKS